MQTIKEETPAGGPGYISESLKGTNMATIPTAADSRKYRDYEVVVLDSVNKVSYIPSDEGMQMRCILTVRRVPSTKKFACYVRRDVTASERALAERWATEMPLGGWARFPDLWKRRTYKGVVVFEQFLGTALEGDTLIDLELELMLDVDLNFSSALADFERVN